MKKPLSTAKILALAYVSLLLVSLSYMLNVLPTLRTDSSVLSLLPNLQSPNQSTEQAFLKRLDNQLFFFITAPDSAKAVAAVHEFREALQNHPLIERTFTGPADKEIQQFGEWYHRHAASLLDTDTREKLLSGTQPQFVLSQLYLPLGGAMGSEIRTDPLLLIRSRQLYELSHSPNRFKRQGPLSYVEDQGQKYFLLYAVSKQDGFATNTAQILGDYIDAEILTLCEHHQGVEVLKRGTIFYNRYFAQSAQHDLTYLGSCTLGGVVLLLVMSFRSLIPLVLTLISIGSALCLGICAVILCFGSVHLITLVMGISIIGICTDYSIYYLTRRLLHGKNETAAQSLMVLKTVLTHALLTTAAAYLLLLLPPFPGLRQLSIFCIFGLLGAYAAVILWQPLLSDRLKAFPYKLAAFEHLLKHWQALRLPLTVCCALIALSGLLTLHIDDDPQALQATPEFLQHDDHRIGQLLGQDNSQTFVLIKATTEEQLAAAVTPLRTLLEEAVTRQYISGFILPNYNSPLQQQADFALINMTLPETVKLLTPLNLAVANFRYPENLLSFKDYIDGPEGLMTANLYLENEAESSLLIPLQGLTQTPQLRRLMENFEGLSISVIDRRKDFTSVFKTYRQSLGYLLLLALTLLFIIHLYSTRKFTQTLRLMLPTVLALLCAVGANALCGYPVTLFTLLSLFLVLGIGIDYVLIFRQGTIPAAEILFAVTMCLGTTLLTLGVLMFSSTAVIASFGLTLSVGILTTYLLAPWTLQSGPRQV